MLMRKQILKRRDVMDLLGLDPDDVNTYRKYLKTGLLKPVRLKGIKYRRFRRIDVLQAFGLPEPIL
jgi:hypothetical protein